MPTRPSTFRDVTASPVVVRTATVPTPPTPPREYVDPCAVYGIACGALYQQFRNDHPQFNSCLGDRSQPRTAFMSLCCQWQRGHLTPDVAWKRWTAYVLQRCDDPNAPPNPPPTSTPPTITTPPTVNTPPAMPPPPNEETFDDIPGDHGEITPGDTDTPSVSQPRSAVKTWGPIVGIGLLVALGWTFARKNKSRRSTRRR